jgi:hypothetical protein
MPLNLKWWLEAGAEIVARKGPFVVVNPPHRLGRCSILFYNGEQIGEIFSKTIPLWKQTLLLLGRRRRVRLYENHIYLH